MGAFDLAAWGAGILAPNNALTTFNQQLHENPAYNMFQFAASALAVFSGSAYQTMKPMPKVCFVAGTMVATATGLVAIEKIKAGDKVLSTDVVSMEHAGKPVLETFMNTANELVRVAVGGEEILATLSHPFFVANKGWTPAADLASGSTLLLQGGVTAQVESATVERFIEPVSVYNLEVAEWHTYHVGAAGILVHNVCEVTISESRYPESARHIREAVEEGKPKTLSIDRAGATARRRESLRGIDKVPGRQLDEYPPAMFAEGGLRPDGSRASVRAISPSDNMGSGASFGGQLRGQPDGTEVTFRIVP
jgi:hypothetical protein